MSALSAVLATVLALNAQGAVSIPPGKYFPASNPVPGRFIVVVDDDYVAAHGMRALTDQVEQRRPGAVRRRWTSALNGFALVSDSEFARTLANEPWVKWVEEDQPIHTLDTQTGASWGLDRLDQRDLPFNGTFAYAVTASNVNIYVIDSGINAAHPYFQGRAFGAYTAIYDQWGTDDGLGHGTFVAGIVASSLFGAAKAARVYSVRVIDANGDGLLSDLIDGINWVNAHHVSPAIANVSVGGPKSLALDTAIGTGTLAGVTYVVAAGNLVGQESNDACNYSPSGAPSAIVVGASTDTDAMASWSYVGSCVDLFAPGSFVNSTCAPVECGATLTRSGSGTSFAAPYVAAIAAQYLAMYPSATPATVASAITGNASAGKLTGVPSGTSNRLLFAPPVCAAPQSTCGYACKNLSNDRANCGACGRGCGSGIKCFDEYGWYYAGTSCVNGACVSNPCE